jgi:DNA-binding beta-propeller fold protein YncE
MKKQYRASFPLFLMLAFWTIGGNAAGQGVVSALGPDTLYVGDVADSRVKSFSAKDGSPAGFTTQQGQLKGPMGLFTAVGDLVVVNQNLDRPLNGEILQYLLRGGTFAGPLVDHRDADAPFAPRGVVLLKGLKGVLYVANLTGNDTDPAEPGAVYVFAGDGKLLGKLTPPSPLRFFPRGIVYNPSDRLLYVSNSPNFTNATGPGNGGQVLTFDPNTFEFKDVFIDDSAGGVGHLNRPEGLVFGPDDKLYITSFRYTLDPTKDTDSVRVYSSAGAFLDSISLYDLAKDEPRAFAQAILFGPGGKLFVPISGGGPATGQIRRYDVLTKNFDIFVQGGILGSPNYLTFGGTNPATLAYEFGK